STYLGRSGAPQGGRYPAASNGAAAVGRGRQTPQAWRAVVAGILGLAVVGAASASTSAQQSSSVQRSGAAHPALGLAASESLPSSAQPNPDSGDTLDAHSAQARRAAPDVAGAELAAADARARAQQTAARAKAAAQARTKSTASRSRIRAAAKAPAAVPALGPIATLSRTPTARSTRITRVAARAFPDFTQFTWVGPVSGTHQTSGFGQRWGRLHAGLDFAGPVGTRLRSMSSGVVTFAGQQGGYGNKVELLMWDGSLAYYGHLDSIAVKSGQKVAPGQLIGRLGNTGHSTGPHVHIEVHPSGANPIDPWPWLVARGVLPRNVPRT
ncbi:MAG: M23 family metallopeptidase, partial [Micrococcales bacterium]|nr:M23 family metallopeptidase [Micrococcales bacterium]